MFVLIATYPDGSRGVEGVFIRQSSANEVGVRRLDLGDYIDFYVENRIPVED